MCLIEKLSNKVGNKISTDLNLDQDSKDVIIYGAFTLLQTLIGIICIIFIATIFNVLKEAIIIVFCSSLLRKYSGGVHATTPNRCIVIGTTIIILLSLIVKNIFYSFNVISIFLLSVLAMIISYYIICKYAPVDSAAKPIKKIATKQKFKKYSITILIIFIAVILILFRYYYRFRNVKLISIVNCIYMGVLWQSCTLTNIGHVFVRKFDKFLGIILKTWLSIT